ncbi:hypothetical protein Tco_1004598 [Tanacetum coccineum]|uniref:Uncharacterized protein n=1 Tax=Tanacetum coccineum TaxID=301880 RepID=A0ABQ5FDQ4_9ASTR
MYLIASRPDIMFAVCACARFQVTPKVSHLHVMKRIFRYLKGKPKLGLWYPKDSPFNLEAFSDSDYAGASLDRCCGSKIRCLIMDHNVANLLTKAFDVNSIRDKFGNKTGSCKVNTARQSRMDGRTCNIKQKCVKSQIPKRGRDTKIPQSGGPPEKVGDEAVHKELGDIMERAATTALARKEECRIV